MNQNLAFTFLDIYFNPGFSFDKTILPGTTYCPIDPLNGFVKTDDILWFSLYQININFYINKKLEVLKPIIVEWFNNRFSEKFGVVHSLFLFD
jgi:hypothetical protein